MTSTTIFEYRKEPAPLSWRNTILDGLKHLKRMSWTQSDGRESCQKNVQSDQGRDEWTDVTKYIYTTLTVVLSMTKRAKDSQVPLQRPIYVRKEVKTVLKSL